MIFNVAKYIRKHISCSDLLYVLKILHGLKISQLFRHFFLLYNCSYVNVYDFKNNLDNIISEKIYRIIFPHMTF